MRLSEEKQITSTLRQFQPEGAGLKYKLQKNFRSTQTASSSFLLLAVNVAAPFIGMAVAAKIKNPQIGQATTNILKSVSGGKILSLTDLGFV